MAQPAPPTAEQQLQHHENDGKKLMEELSDSDDSFAMEEDTPSRPPAAQSKPTRGSEPDIEALQLHEDETEPAVAATTATEETPETADYGNCCQCGLTMGATKGAITRDGPLHLRCIVLYKFQHQPRCSYCDIRFRDSEAHSFVKEEATGALFHSDCYTRHRVGEPYVRPTKEGMVRKYAIARSKLTRHNWKSRYFVLSPANRGIRYYTEMAAAPAAGTGKPSDGSNTDGLASRGTDADPDRDAKEEDRRSKGHVPLDERSRLITRPNISTYRTSSSTASDTNIGIIFFESKDSQTERRLIFQCSSVPERNEWITALEAYIHTVDDPADYAVAVPTAAPRPVEEKEEEKK